MLKYLWSIILIFPILAPNGISQEIQTGALAETEIVEAWLVRQKIQTANNSLVENQLKTIQNLQLKYGLSSIPSISNALLNETINSESSVFREKKVEYARLFSNDSSLVDHFLCGSERSFSAVKYCLHAYKKDLASHEGKLRFLANLSTILLGTLFLTALGFSILLILKRWNASVLFLSYKTPTFTSWGFSIIQIIVLMTAYLLLGSWGLFMMTIFLLARYFDFQEKICVSFLLVFFLLVPTLLRNQTYKMNYDLSVARIYEFPYEDFDFQNKIKKLENHLSTYTKDAFALFTLARLHYKLGNVKQALAYFERAQESNPKWHKPLINIAAIRYKQDQTQEAINALKQASKVNPNSTYAFFNLARIFIQETRLEEAQSALNKAKETNSDLFQILEQKSKAYPKNQLLEEDLSEQEISALVKPVHSKAATEIEESLVAYYTKLGSLKLYYLLSILFIIYLWLIQKVLPLPKDFLQIIDHSQVSRSQQFDILNPLSAQNVLGQFNAISSFWTKLKSGWLSLIFPGSHYYFKGNTITAFTILVILGLLLSPLIMGHLLLSHPQLAIEFGLTPINYMNIGFLILLYSGLIYLGISQSNGT